MRSHPVTGVAMVWRLREKECLIPDGYQALISWDVRIQLYPLPSMAWKREVKTIVAHALHTRIFYLKTHYLGICQTEDSHSYISYKGPWTLLQSVLWELEPARGATTGV